MTKPRVLLIDDESKIRQFVGIALSAENYAFYQAENGLGGLAEFERCQPHVVILDLGLPDIDGYHVLRKLRAHSTVPVLVLTARDEEKEKVKLLLAGANDYLCKPFGVPELVARLHVLMRDLAYEPAGSILAFTNLHIDTRSHRVKVDNQDIELTPKEYKVLFMLASQPDNLVTQHQLLLEVWGPNHVDDSHYLRVLFTSLRKKLGDNPDLPRFIQTVPGVGYRFITPALPG